MMMMMMSVTDPQTSYNPLIDQGGLLELFFPVVAVHYFIYISTTTKAKITTQVTILDHNNQSSFWLF